MVFWCIVRVLYMSIALYFIHDIHLVFGHILSHGHVVRLTLDRVFFFLRGYLIISQNLFDNLLKYGKLTISGENKPLFYYKKSKNKACFFYTSSSK